MKSFVGCVAGLVVAAGLLLGSQAGAMTVAGPGTTVNTAEVRETEVTGIITSIDAKQGVLVVAGRTYRFDPETVSFLDQRREPPGGGLAALKAGSKVALLVVVQDGAEQLLRIVAQD
jgi:hypothetical protein